MNPDRPHDDLIALLAPRMNDVRARQTFLVSALGLSDPLIHSLDYNQPARAFILHLCSQIKPDTDKLDRVLDELKRQLGRDDEIEALRPQLHRWLTAGAPDAATPRIRVFLSYARADDAGDDRAAYDDPARSFMRRLHDALADEFALWWDMADMPSRGEAFTAEIEAAINGCDRLVLVVAPGALVSDYVRAEWRHALARCIPVTPILRRGDYDTIPDQLKDVHAPDFRDARPFADAVDELRRVLREPPGRLGKPLHFERSLPDGHVQREAPFQAARDALLSDAIRATVVSARPQSATAIYGQGGLGKSTLAIALAHDCDVRRRYPDGIIWVKVTQTPDIQTRLAEIGGCFGDPKELYVGPGTDAESAANQLNRTLHGRRALLILDDVWEHQHVSYFRVTDTPCRLLVTTRSSALADRIGGAANIPLNALSDAEGAALIAARAGGSPDDPIYMQISRALAGHTLAVTLAAARLKKRGAGYAQTILDGLNDPKEPFASLDIDPEDKDLNLSKSLALSYDALDDDGQRRFRALGVFAANAAFDLAALAAVWGEAEASADRAAEALVDASLLDWERESGRFSQHPVLRTYARALLTAAGEMPAVFQRYADWVIKESEAFDRLPLEQWDQLDPLIPHVTEVGDALVDRFAESLPEQLAAFAWNVGRFVNHRMTMIDTPRGREARGLRWLEAGLVVFRQNGDQAKAAVALNNIGLAWAALGEQRKALDYYQQALTLCRAVGDRGGEAAALNNIGLAWAALGEQRKALDCYEQALPVFRAVGDRGGEAAALNNIGGAWSALGEQRQALDYYQQALTLYRAVGDRGGEAAALNNIGLAWAALGEQRKALDCYEQALPLRRAVGDRGGEAAALNNIGLAWAALGEQRQALDYFEQALPLRRAVGDRGGEATTLNNIGGAWDALGEKRKALDYYEQALTLCRAVGDRRGEAAALNNIGLAWAALGEQRQALDYYEQALPLRRAVGDRGGEAAALNNTGGAWAALGEQRQALDCYEQALPLRRAVGDRGGEATTLNNIGLAWAALGEQRQALDYYQQALPLCRAVGDRGGEATTLNNIGGAWAALGEQRKALDCYEQALALCRAVGDRGGEATTLNNIGRAWYALGEQRKALDYYEQALALCRAVGDRGGEAAALNNIGGAWYALGEQRKALDCYEQALPVFRAVGDRGGEATTLNNIGLAWAALGEQRKALDCYEQALPVFRAVGDRGGKAVTCFNIGLIYHELGDLDRAIEFVERCVELDEQIAHPDLESDRRTLNQLKAMRESGAPPFS